MKKLIYIVAPVLLLAISSLTAGKLSAQSCNQVEILYTSPDCLRDDHQEGASGGKGCKPIAVCVDNLYTYTSSIVLPGWTYNWTATGPSAVTINPNNTAPSVTISWPLVGVYTLTLTATDPSGNVFTYCLTVNVKAKPVANFTFTPNNVCAPSTISFTNTTTYSGGGVAYSWNFGDIPSGSNNFSTAINPTHLYNSAGTYTVTLIAYSFTTVTSSSPVGDSSFTSIKTCCADTITKVVTIKPGTFTIECVSTVCAGDTATYHATGCPNPTWVVTGGTIQSQAGDSVTVVWGNGNPQGQLQATCGACTVSVTVPIIPTNPVIVGNISPCNTSTTSYTLPVLPGTFYTWTLNNISTSTNYDNLLNTYPDNNTVWINWSSAPAGTYQLTINLQNKHICCSSTGSLLINPSGTWTAFTNKTICAGAGANLYTFPAAGTFVWTVIPPNAGVTPIAGGPGNMFNPIFTIPGDYVVEVYETAGTYCNSGIANKQQIKIKVIGVPLPGAINGPATGCVGSTYSYSMSTAAPSGYHYEWSVTGGAGLFQPGSLTNVNGDAASVQWSALTGTISVYLVSNGNPACSSAVVTKNTTLATIGTITGTMNVCVDGTGTYTLSGVPPGETVNWSISLPSQGTIISPPGSNPITVLWHGNTSGPGPWSATINATMGCGNPPPLTGIQVYPKFTFTITKTGIDICQPGGVTLTATGAPPGANYTWSPGGPSGPGAVSKTNITTTGTYTVTATLGGCSFTQTYFVEDPFAIIPVTCGVGTCNGTATNEQLGVQVIKPGVGTFTYQWYSGTYPSGTLIPGATTANYTAPTNGNFYVVVTYGTCQKHVSFNVKKVCCPDVNHPAITSVVRNSCTSYTFTGTTPNPTGATITWNFGDGNTATGTSGTPITHVYSGAGVYCVTFCVGPPSPNPTNCTGNCVATTVTVPIQAAFLYTLGCNGCLNVTNTSTVITSNPSFVTYLWNYGDGNTSTAQNPSQHCYSSGGTYTVTLTITYNDGVVNCTSTATQIVNYTPLAISVNPSPVCTGVSTAFNIVGSPSFTIVTSAWTFGDGFTAYTIPTTHIYNAPGASIPVTLTITDALGNTCNANTTVNVLPGITSCTILPAFICPGGSATLTGPNIAGATYLWEVETTPGNFVPAPGTNNTMTYTTNVPGFYHVIVTGSNGCKCTSNKVEVKAVIKPKAIIAVTPSSKLCGPGYITLTSINHLTGYTSDWYANGNYGSLLSTGQSYYMNVTTTTVFNLVLTNEYGCKDTCSLMVTVNPIPAQPIISSSPTLCEGVPITLTVTNYANNITWNTGAATTSITVSAAGIYTATYTDPVTGCSSSKNIKINRRPPTDLFPHYCEKVPCTCRDSLGNFTIYAPLPLVGAFAANYNIQWYFNNAPVGSNGNNPTYSPAMNGTYHIVVTDPMTGCKDTSDKYSVIVLPCDTCNCDGSSWGDIILAQGEKPAAKTSGNAKANVPQGQKIYCKETYELKCNQPYTIYPTYNCKDTLCPSKVTYSLQPPSGSPITGTAPVTFTPTISGTYTLTLYGWCNGKICDSCVITFKVSCEKPCDCKGSKWTGITLSQQNNNTNPAAAGKVGNNNNPVINPVKLDCGKTYDVKCKAFYSVNAGYSCAGANCPGSVQYVFTGPTGTTTGTMPLNFSLTLSGTYTLTLYGYCGTTKCDSCKIYFKVDCPPVESDCCPYNITVENPTTTLTTLSAPPATIANSTFNISGPPGNLFTEIRAEVVDYVLTSNFNNECLSCKTYPYAWASMYQPGNAGAIPPKITMYNSTAPSFNPAGIGMYQNPREVVWNSTTPFALPSSLNLSFLLPAASVIDCCELSAKICVKFTFRDNNCKECEVIVCFTVIIKPGGGTNSKECNCSIKPLLKWEGGSKTLSCGETIDLFAGNIPVSLQPNFECKDGNGKDCKSSGPTVTIKKPNNTTQVLTGPNYNYTYSLSMPGTFEYTIVGICNGKKCECKFYVVNPKK
ncbi:MAG: PKD domain-containing protein [Chitinophagaceae bacterium]